MAEFEQLASDALVTPERVLLGQPQHQLSVLGREQRSTRIAPTMDQRPMPAENRGRLHQEQGTGRELAAEASHDQAIGHPQARSSSCASEDQQLLAEDKEFEIPIGSRAGAEDEEVDQQAKESIKEGQQHGRAE